MYFAFYVDIICILYFVAKTNSIHIGLNGKIDVNLITRPANHYRHRADIEIYKNGVINMDSSEVREYKRIEEQQMQKYNHSKIKKHPKKTKNKIKEENGEMKRPHKYNQTTKRYKVIFNKPGKVENNDAIRDYTSLIFNKYLRICDEIKEELADEDIKKVIDEIIKDFEEGFREFINSIRNLRIQTEMEATRIILQTINTTGQIIEKSMNKLKENQSNIKRSLKNKLAISNIIKYRVENETVEQINYICNTFGICSSGDNFTKVLLDIANITSQYDEDKFSTVINAFVQALQGRSFANVLPNEVEKQFKDILVDADKYAKSLIRDRFDILKNIAEVRNNRHMITIVGGTENFVSVLAFLDILKQLDEALPSDPSETVTWTKVTSGFEEYMYGTKGDDIITENAEFMVKHVTEAFEKMDDDFKDRLSRNVQEFLGNTALAFSTVKYNLYDYI